MKRCLLPLLLLACSARAELLTPSCAGQGYPAAYPGDETLALLKEGMRSLKDSPQFKAIADSKSEEPEDYINFLSEGYCRAGFDYWATFELVYRAQRYTEEFRNPSSGELIEPERWYPMHGMFMVPFYASSKPEFRQELRTRGWLSEDFYFVSELE